MASADFNVDVAISDLSSSYLCPDRLEIAFADAGWIIQHQLMLTRLYVEALLADTDLANQVWELWNAGVITDDLAGLAWGILGRGESHSRLNTR